MVPGQWGDEEWVEESSEVPPWVLVGFIEGAAPGVRPILSSANHPVVHLESPLAL